MFIHWIKRISFLFVGLILFGNPVCAAPRSDGQRLTDPPNIVLIVLDACREDRIDATRKGVPVMPYLSRFPGVRFRQAVSAAPWTTPSVVSILTSLNVNTHQVYSPKTRFPSNIESASTYLKEAGYATLCVQTNGMLILGGGFKRDFDVFDFQLEVPADKVTSLALDHVANATPPFFLYAHYMDTHDPYWAPENHRTLMGYPNPGLISAEQAVVEKPFRYIFNNNAYLLGRTFERSFPELSTVGKEALAILYDSAARFADEQSGILIDTLLANYPNTVVVVVADHGEHLWEHGFLGHTLTLYEPLIHVPLFIKAPGLPLDTMDSPIELVDILPTVAALAGLPARPFWQGRDLFSHRHPHHPVFSCGKFDMLGYTGESEAIRLDSMKLIFNRRLDTLELYDLSEDPGEMTNLALTQSAVAEQLMALLYTNFRANALANGSDGPVRIIPRNSSTVEGAKIALKAGAGTGHRWFKDGRLLAEDAPRVVGTDISMLTIRSLDLADTGDYECIYHDVDTQGLRITDPFALQVIPNTVFFKHKTLIAVIFICIAFVLVFLACFRLWKRV